MDCWSHIRTDGDPYHHSGGTYRDNPPPVLTPREKQLFFRSRVKSRFLGLRFSFNSYRKNERFKTDPDYRRDSIDTIYSAAPAPLKAFLRKKWPKNFRESTSEEIFSLLDNTLASEMEWGVTIDEEEDLDQAKKSVGKGSILAPNKDLNRTVVKIEEEDEPEKSSEDTDESNESNCVEDLTPTELITAQRDNDYQSHIQEPALLFDKKQITMTDLSNLENRLGIWITNSFVRSICNKIPIRQPLAHREVIPKGQLATDNTHHDEATTQHYPPTPPINHQTNPRQESKMFISTPIPQPNLELKPRIITPHKSINSYLPPHRRAMEMKLNEKTCVDDSVVCDIGKETKEEVMVTQPKTKVCDIGQHRKEEVMITQPEIEPGEPLIVPRLNLTKHEVCDIGKHKTEEVMVTTPKRKACELPILDRTVDLSESVEEVKESKLIEHVDEKEPVENSVHSRGKVKNLIGFWENNCGNKPDFPTNPKPLAVAQPKQTVSLKSKSAKVGVANELIALKEAHSIEREEIGNSLKELEGLIDGPRLNGVENGKEKEMMKNEEFKEEPLVRAVKELISLFEANDDPLEGSDAKKDLNVELEEKPIVRAVEELIEGEESESCITEVQIDKIDHGKDPKSNGVPFTLPCRKRKFSDHSENVKEYSCVKLNKSSFRRGERRGRVRHYFGNLKRGMKRRVVISKTSHKTTAKPKGWKGQIGHPRDRGKCCCSHNKT